MFSREHRLRRSKEIVATLRTGRRFSMGPLSCSFIAKPDRVSRVTVIVGTAVSKRSVERNLLKRRVRAALRDIGLPAGDLVVRLFPEARGLDYARLHEHLKKCLSRLSST